MADLTVNVTLMVFGVTLIAGPATGFTVDPLIVIVSVLLLVPTPFLS